MIRNSTYPLSTDYNYKNYKVYVHHRSVLYKIYSEDGIQYKDLLQYTKSLVGKNGYRIKENVAKGILTWLLHRNYIYLPNRCGRSIVSITDEGIAILENKDN